MATITGDFGTLVIETEMVDVTSALPQADKSWRYTDRQGHEHYWRDGYPTLDWVPDGEPYWDSDISGEYQHMKLVCPVCDEEIHPSTYVDTSRRYVPGLTWATLNGEPISEDRARQLIESLRS
jgi:hypothetical protein